MEYLREKIKKEIVKILRDAGIEAGLEEIVAPPKKEMGDFSYPIFKEAKSRDKNPTSLAREIVEKVKAKKYIKKIEAAGPYVNFFANEKEFCRQTLEEIETMDGKYGQNDTGDGQKLMIEFSQPNTHKQFHIGHARGTLLGQSLVNILRSQGYRVISANYFGDTGAHVAKWLWAYLKFHPGEKPGGDPAKFMNQIYQEAVEKISQNEKYKKEVSKIQQELEAGDKDLVKLWKKTRKWSIEQFEEIYKKLGIKFDEYFYESEEEQEGKKLVNELLEKGIAKESQGAIIIDLEKYNLGIFLILKSDGTSLYATKDLALAKKKFEKFKIDQSWYVVDVRQKQYFEQLFKTLDLMGFKKPMRHVSYAFVATPEGVVSSRAGEVPSFREFFNYLVETATISTKERHQDWETKKIQQTAEKIALAAIKFEMLKSSRDREIIIDPKEAVSFEGFTGPYILYTLARINSILKQAKPAPLKNIGEVEVEPVEMSLVGEMARFPQAASQAAIDADPAQISQYLFELSQKFSEFYHQAQVLKASPEIRNWRLNILISVRSVLLNGLEMLNIEPLEEM